MQTDASNKEAKLFSHVELSKPANPRKARNGGVPAIVARVRYGAIVLESAVWANERKDKATGDVQMTLQVGFPQRVQADDKIREAFSQAVSDAIESWDGYDSAVQTAWNVLTEAPATTNGKVSSRLTWTPKSAGKGSTEAVQAQARAESKAPRLVKNGIDRIITEGIAPEAIEAAAELLGETPEELIEGIGSDAAPSPEGDTD